jgi:hypothetical protein
MLTSTTPPMWAEDQDSVSSMLNAQTACSMSLLSSRLCFC